MLDEFDTHPKERELIGSMLMAYGEIEFALIGCIAEILDDDVHTTTRVLFRVNGEGARLNVADAILRPAMRKLDLVDDWITTYAAAQFCKNVRNQYAHCHWQIDHRGLFFIDLDEDAKPHDEIMLVNFRPIDLPLLEKQANHFDYTLAWLYFLKENIQVKNGKPLSGRPFPKPKSIPQPPRDNRPKKDAPTPPGGLSKRL